MNVVHKLTPFNEIIDLMIDKDRELLEKTKYEVKPSPQNNIHLR